jgi:hypothetical protein
MQTITFFIVAIMARVDSISLAVPGALDVENWHFIERREISVLGDDGYAVPQCGRSDPGVVAAEAPAARPLGRCDARKAARGLCINWKQGIRGLDA